MEFRPLPAPSPTRPCHIASMLALATLLAFLSTLGEPAQAAVDDSPPPTGTPAAPADRIRPLVGVLVTHSISSERTAVSNPDGSAASVDISGRYEVHAGAEFPVAANGLAIRLSAGVHTTQVSTANGAERFTRYPLEASLLYPLDDHVRIGAGVIYPMRNRFSGPGGQTADGLSSTPGLVLSADYRVGTHLSLDLRYVIDDIERAGGGSIDANYVGVGATARY